MPVTLEKLQKLDNIPRSIFPPSASLASLGLPQLKSPPLKSPPRPATPQARPVVVPLPVPTPSNQPVEAPGTVADTIGEQVTLAARRPNAPIAVLEGEERHTWAEIDKAVDHLACGLLALGCKRGDRIGVVAPNQVEWLHLFYAAARIGVALVGLSVRYRDADLAHMLADSEVKVLFTVPEHEGFDFMAMMRRLQPRLPALRHVITIGGDTLTSLASIGATPVDITRLAQARRQVRPDDTAMVIYTSGTTGRPKGAGLTHRSMLASAAAQAAHLRITDADLLHLANPLNHVGGITCGALAHLVGGGSLVLLPEFKADRLLALMARHRPTIVAGVPTMLTLMLEHPSCAKVDFSAVRVVYCGGSSVDPVLMERLGKRMPNATLMNIYGLSETSGGVVMTPWTCSREQRMGTIGQPLPGVNVRVVDDTGRPVPTGQVGELWIQGAGVVPGYIGTAAGQGFSSDGWLMTGDLGSVDAKGSITLKGRKKDMYIQGGFNVYPAEVEALIARHPQVLVCAVIGVADPLLGEVGRAYVIPRADAKLTETDLRQWCGAQLADYKVPKQVVLREALPMTPAGKIHKAVLRDEAARGL